MRKKFLALLVPLLGYLAVTVIVPLINGALSKDAGLFLEHSVFVVAGSATVYLLVLLLLLFIDKCRNPRYSFRGLRNSFYRRRKGSRT